MDRTDVKILEQLAADGSISNKTLAATVGLSPSTCLERVRRLKESGAIRGIYADVDVAVVGVRLEALLFIRLTKHTARVVNDFFEHALSLPETRSAFIITGQHDVIVHVAAQDTKHLKELIINAFTSVPEVSGIETVIIFDVAHRRQLPRRGGDAGAISQSDHSSRQ
jgi:DNA-binding Lrp family transcriptional regulator